MQKTYSENQLIFRHKKFYLKHLVLTDIHYPTANLLAHSVYLKQEAVDLHCITLLSIDHSSRSNTTRSIQEFTKIQMPASKISKHPFCPSHRLLGDIFYKHYQKQFVPRIYQHQLPYKTPTVLLQQQTNTVKCQKKKKKRKFRAELVLMCSDARRTWFISVRTAGRLVEAVRAVA